MSLLSAFVAPSASGANTALSNLANVSLNTTLALNDNLITGMGTGLGFGKWEKLFTFIDTEAVSSIVFTPATNINLLTTYSRVIGLVSGNLSASADLELIVNSKTDYNSTTILSDSGTVSGANIDADATFVFIPVALLDANDRPFFGIVELIGHQSNAGTDNVLINAVGYADSEGYQVTGGMVQGTTSDLDTLNIQVSTGAFRNNLEVKWYGELR